MRTRGFPPLKAVDTIRRQSLRAGILSVAILLVGGAVPLFCQKSPIPYSKYNLSGVDVTKVAYTYPGNYSSMREVDFRNLPVHEFNDKGRSVGVTKLKNGEFHEEKIEGEPPHQYHERIDFQLDEVFYITEPGADPEYAVVAYWDSDIVASSAQFGRAQIFRLTKHRLEVTAALEWDEHHEPPPFVSYDGKSKTLTIRTNHYLPGEGRCCPSATDIFTLRWDGARFVRMGVRTELSEIGKREGKTLPVQRTK